MMLELQKYLPVSQAGVKSFGDQFKPEDALTRQGNPESSFESFEQLAAEGQIEEFRSVSAVCVFFVFVVGAVTGVFWSVVFSWLLF